MPSSTPSRQSRISALAPDLQERLRRRLAGQARQTDAIPAAHRTGPLPMSFSQQRLWFLNDLLPEDDGYNSGLALRLTGVLDQPALNRALQDLLARHESLRTTFDEIDGAGIQVVHPVHELPVPVVDLRSDPRPDALDQVLLDEYSRPFDLRQGPLLRVLLVRTAEDEHVLTLCMHHIVTDGWPISRGGNGSVCPMRRSRTIWATGSASSPTSPAWICRRIGSDPWCAPRPGRGTSSSCHPMSSHDLETSRAPVTPPCSWLSWLPARSC
jgi:hypothetical protein